MSPLKKQNMLAIPGLSVQAQIYESANSRVYRAIRESDSQPLILKLLKEDYPTPAELARYRTEYQITKSLNLPGVVKVYDLQKYQNTLLMSVEDFGGESLNILMQQRSFTLEEFLQIAIQATESLALIHAAHIIHKDINPSNIVFNPRTGQLKIIDFGISTQLSRENTALKNPNVLEGTLAYMSPEQTGRMNRALDYRTDFYSLGVTFYKLLTNKLPFETTEPLELVHCHIAKQPLPPCEVNPEIPKVVSDIVMKLMAKTAEERYQSALGIKADLEECLNQIYRRGIIPDFPIARQDISDKFQLSQKLYGREREIDALLEAFARATSDKSSLMLIAGYSGIGKSALVQELYKPITEKRGYFISGKFDQYQRNIPYSAVVSAFRELVKQLLTETEVQLQEWREKLQDDLGINGQVIVEVIPEVELIIGKQPDVPEIGPNESQNRFNFVFQNFIKVFTQPERPLALFLDDLQWADGASLKLMQVLMSDSAPGLFLIGAYRDNEVSAAHPLTLTIEEIVKAGATVNRISLSPLELPAVTHIISDTLGCSEGEAQPLADLVLVKTGGNPFFLNEFLKSLYTERLLEFERETSKWQWSLEEIKARGFTDNVVELMAGKIQRLPESGQEMLKLATCIGNQFDLKTLSAIAENSLSETAIALQAAAAEGLVVPLGSMGDVELAIAQTEFPECSKTNAPETISEYKFVHDRIQQAAYTLIPDSAKQAVHQKIGQILLKNTPSDKLEEKIFDIVNQLNFGIGTNPGGAFLQLEKDELAGLNLIAGKKAKLSAAYQPALNYLQVGIGLLAADSWQQQYDLTLSLYEQAAEVAYLNADFSLMERLSESVLSRAQTILDKVKVYEVKIQVCTAQSQFNEAIVLGLEVLNSLGVALPKNPSQFDVLWGLLRTKLTIGFRSVPSLVDLPSMTAPYHKVAMRILAKIAPAAFFAAPLLLPLIVLKQVSLSIKWGNASESPYSYSCYGMILCGVLGEIETGYQFGQLALNLLSQLDARVVKARTELMIPVTISHWVEPVKETLLSMLEAYAAGLETGDLEFAAYSAFNYCCYAFLSGSELTQLESEMTAYDRAIRQMGHKRTVDAHELFHQTVLNLTEQSENPCSPLGTAFDEEAMLSNLHSSSDRTGISYLYFNKLMLCFLFEEQAQAVANAEVAEKYLDSLTALLVVPHFYFYDSLARLAVAAAASRSERKRLMRKVLRNQKKMQKWAHRSPANNLHKFYLVEAERERVLGKDLLAMEMYDKAIATARENEYIHEEAIAHELAAKFYLSRRKPKIASIYMQDARYCYQLWGAAAKVKDLERRYPDLLSRNTSVTRTSGSNTASTSFSTSGSRRSSELDLAAVMKASQAIAGEILLDKLLEKLMQILMENAGAQKGFLILESKGVGTPNVASLRIEAAGAVDTTGSITVLESIPIEDVLPTAIVNYVARTKESIVLDDAVGEIQNPKCQIPNLNDPYILENKPKSVLCAPLLNKGQLTGILYLENNLTAGAFTPERLEVLKLLSGQAAISIENAKLYADLRDSESRLAQFLEAVPVGVFVVDATGKPYYVNQRAQQILGKGVAPDATTEQLAEAYQAYIAGSSQLYPLEQIPVVRALRGKSSTVDNIEIHQPNKIVPVEVWGTPIYDAQGNISYGIAAFQDITERKKAEAERKKFTYELFQLNLAYERFLPRQFIHLLNRESIIDVKLGDQVQLEMAVLFSDIREFTTLSESMTPEDNFKFINAYLSRMEPAITENHGFIDKYIGDAIMALFSGEADNAVKAGISMLYRLHEYNQHRAKSGYAPIQIGIGINTGSLMLGTVGGQNRMDGTVISDAVNLASRVEGLTKNYGVALLITEQTYSRLRNPADFAARSIDTVKVKGKSQAVTVYEIFEADLPEIKAGKFATLPIFTEARLLYNSGKINDAGKLFKKCLRFNPGDTVAQIYLQRCQQYWQSR